MEETADSEAHGGGDPKDERIREQPQHSRGGPGKPLGEGGVRPEG